MIRGTTQCLTGKAEGPHHPFFIGSRPGPVFCGGIFPSFFDQPQNCDPGVLISENILSKSVGKPKFSYLPILRRCWTSQDPGGGCWDSLLCGGRILQQAVEDPLSPPALLLRGFRVPEAEAAGPPGWTGRRKAGARRTVGSSGFSAGQWDQARRFLSARCRRGRHVHTLHWRGIGLFRSFPPLLNLTVKSRLAFGPSV